MQGSPVTVMLETKSAGCGILIHVGGAPLYDHREALRPATRPVAHPQPDYEGEN
jgi:hypothetical protein